ncbi:hypothetical protein RGQ15_09585 [Paracoccus sp. MBLB3053]|uniref:AbiTii domain-containing protein n=1 Tax=Paracoccus aurantius TaxID=3073814 RepID=A0ABU2HS23_9RHOB|nr:hypothetical protein [Paracoccus sp. MBLB3053]MDS9467818.1 hypothetical protein [Paracoccus sp. MBLB3053]
MASSLIGEITEGAMTGEKSLVTLLRMMKVAALRLGLPEVESWVDTELNGYVEEEDVPEYRNVTGQVVVKSHYRGWEIVSGDPITLSIMQQRNLGASVALLETMMAQAMSNGNSGTFTIFFSPQIVEKFIEGNAGHIAAAGTRITSGQVAAVLDHVRGKILDWAIEMEKQGVVGENMTFSKEEKEEAARVMNNITVHGSVGTFAGNIGAGNASGAITVNTVDIPEALNLARELQQHTPALIAAGATPSLERTVAEINIELSSPNPDTGRVGGLVDLAKNALAGASGNLMATGAIALLEKIVTSIGG